MALSWDPYAGRKVVCVMPPGATWTKLQGEHVPESGRVYTIRTATVEHDGEVYLRLYEVVNAPRVYWDGPHRYVVCECTFEARAFRPVDERETDISIFTALLDSAGKARTKEDA